MYQKENGQWYYTGKELTEDLTIQYVERGGYPDAVAAVFLSTTLDGYVRENLMSGVEYFPYPQTSPPVVYNKKQLKTFVQYCIHHYPSIKLEVFLALFCRLRTGEIRGLRFDDCDESTHTIHINRQIVTATALRFTGETVSVQRTGRKEKAPKTESSDRTIQVHPIIFDALKEREKEITISRQKSAIWTPEYHGYISIGKQGNIKSDSTMNSALRTITGNTGLPIVSTHDLRHMAATLLLESCLKNHTGPNEIRDTYSYFADALRRVSRYLGHNNTRITYEIYLHQMYGSEQIRTVAETVMNPMSTFQQKVVTT